MELRGSTVTHGATADSPDKSDNEFSNIKFCRYPMSEKSDLYEFNLTLFDNGDPEEFLLFVRKFNMTLKASQMLQAGAKI